MEQKHDSKFIPQGGGKITLGIALVHLFPKAKCQRQLHKIICCPWLFTAQNPKAQDIIWTLSLTVLMTAISILMLWTSTLDSSYVFKKAVIHCFKLHFWKHLIAGFYEKYFYQSIKNNMQNYVSGCWKSFQVILLLLPKKEVENQSGIILNKFGLMKFLSY